jgi:hypothetical protein
MPANTGQAGHQFASVSERFASSLADYLLGEIRINHRFEIEIFDGCLELLLDVRLLFVNVAMDFQEYSIVRPNSAVLKTSSSATHHRKM